MLEEIRLRIEPGQHVAVLGGTGEGKTTLLNLIPRFYDATAGRVLVDGIDVSHLNLEDLRRNVGVVFQENFLFSDTVAANISFGRPDALRCQIERIARIARRHEFIAKLPNGYDTMLREGGKDLSGGQRQRLAIARAILLRAADPSIGRRHGGCRRGNGAGNPRSDGPRGGGPDRAHRGTPAEHSATRGPRGSAQAGANRRARHA